MVFPWSRLQSFPGALFGFPLCKSGRISFPLLFSLLTSVFLYGHAASGSEMRVVVGEGVFSAGESVGAHYSLSEIRDALETWWPSSSLFDFDAALQQAKKQAKRKLGIWGIETIDRKELVRLLNLSMERFVANQYNKLRASDPLLAQVSLLSDWNVLLLVRQQLTRDRVKTKLTDEEIDNIFYGAPRLYPWLPRDVCEWRPPGIRQLRAEMLPTCSAGQGPRGDL